METKTFDVHEGYFTVTSKYDNESALKVVDRILAWCKEYDVISGESFQCDDPQIYAADLIATIIEKDLNFTYKDNNSEE